ncbi:MAG: MATE family efflux transporter [Lachnospiraceae bacterium]|nr:MATE family efflux transporter [Lachnospiraceae bacterium]
MAAKATDFSKGSVIKNTLSIAVPMIFAQLLNLLYNMVDRMYIGRIPEVGATALTGLGLCFPIITMISAFANLFSSGGTPLFSMERGKHHEEEAGKIMGNCLLLLLICGAILMIIGYLFYRPILFAFGASAETFPYAKDYILIYLLGTLFMMVSLGMNGFINAQGFGTIGMLTVTLGAVANIILDPIFIFVLDIGAKGAALATILSQMLSALWVLQFLTGKRAVIPLNRSQFALSGRRVGKIMTLGLAGFVAGFTNSAVQVACNANLAHYGGDLYVGVMTILNSVREIIMMPVQGLAQGAIPVLSYNYGARNYTKVRQGIRFMTIVCVVYACLMWALLERFPGFFIRIFNSDTALLTAGVKGMHLYFWGIFMMSFQMAGQNVFVSLGKSKQAVFFSLFRKIIIVVPLTYLLPTLWKLGVDGVYIAEPVSNFVGGAACFITMLFTVYPELLGKRKERNQA